MSEKHPDHRHHRQLRRRAPPRCSSTFEQIFRREGINAAVVEGDSFHRYDRDEMKDLMAADHAAGGHLRHFGPEANLFDEVETLFRTYAETGTGKRRYYLHNAEEAERVRPGARHVHAVGGPPGRQRPAVLRGPARRGRGRRRSTARGIRTCSSASCRSSTSSGSRRSTATAATAATRSRRSPTSSCGGCTTTCTTSARSSRART